MFALAVPDDLTDTAGCQMKFLELHLRVVFGI